MITEALCHFWAGPDRQHDAALAWAYELTLYFKRAVGEQPLVTAHPGHAVHRWPGHPYYGEGWYDTTLGLYLNFWSGGPDPVTVYACRGLMTTTHPSDCYPLSIYDNGAAWALDRCLEPGRLELLRKTGGQRWDGRT